MALQEVFAANTPEPAQDPGTSMQRFLRNRIRAVLREVEPADLRRGDCVAAQLGRVRCAVRVARAAQRREATLVHVELGVSAQFRKFFVVIIRSRFAHELDEPINVLVVTPKPRGHAL